MLTRCDNGKHQVSLHCATNNIWSISIYQGSTLLWLGQSVSIPGIYALFRDKLPDVVKLVGGVLALQMLEALESLDSDYQDTIWGSDLDREIESTALGRIKVRRIQ